ncbi:hypothetical protein PA598K_01476 [Paenibacillus sp. 598K]|nr:hypothetical protein PA598K_01476 [Paenibacillus sp. 598K]
MILKTANDFNEAFLQGRRVEVWRGDKLVDYGGPIDRHLKDSVCINGVVYSKHLHKFLTK